MKEACSMEVAGTGAVSPAGFGVEALLRGEAVPVRELRGLGPRGRGHASHPVVDEGDILKRWMMEPRLRRAGRIAGFLAEAARQALAEAGEVPGERLGIVGIFFTGPMEFSRRFFQERLERGQHLAGPALFPDTVYNSPLSHLASILGVRGRVYALVGDQGAWAAGLNVARTWLELGKCDAVLVTGAEELDPIPVEAYRRAGWLRHGLVPSEGAAAMVLRRAGAGRRWRIASVREERGYRTPAEAASAMKDYLASVPPGIPVWSAAGKTWMEGMERELAGGRLLAPPLPYLGEAFVASAGWNAIRAMASPGVSEIEVPLWGLTERVSGLRLCRPSDKYAA